MSEKAEENKKANSDLVTNPTSKVWWILGAMLVLSSVMAVFSLGKLKASANEISPAFAKINKASKNFTDVRQCGERVFQWANKCKGLRFVCGSSVRQMAEACMDGIKDAAAVCKKTDMDKSSGHFSYAQCTGEKHNGGKKRKLTRHKKKLCANIYAAIWVYCQEKRLLGIRKAKFQARKKGLKKAAPKKPASGAPKTTPKKSKQAAPRRVVPAIKTTPSKKTVTPLKK